MLYYLYLNFVDSYTFLNIFQYITFRSFLAGSISFLLVMLLTPRFITIFTRNRVTENINQFLESSHKKKSGTPNMGGAIIAISVIASCFVCGKFYKSLSDYPIYPFAICLITYTIFSFSGFFDDLIKLRRGKGISLFKKLFIQTCLAIVVVVILYQSNIFFSKGLTTISFPFTKTVVELGPFYFLFCFLVIIGSANAVNITDGLDGLATGSIISTVSALIIIAYIVGSPLYASYLYVPFVGGVAEITIFLAAILGAMLAFLWFNSNPAQIFMGDVGSIPLGASIGIVSILIKQEILLLIMGGVFVIEALSVIIQIISFRLFGKRFFLIAPIHHHFEKKGVVESKIVLRFWIVSILLSLFAIATLKIR